MCTILDLAHHCALIRSRTKKPHLFTDDTVEMLLSFPFPQLSHKLLHPARCWNIQEFSSWARSFQCSIKYGVQPKGEKKQTGNHRFQLSFVPSPQNAKREGEPPFETFAEECAGFASLQIAFANTCHVSKSAAMPSNCVLEWSVAFRVHHQLHHRMRRCG